MKKVEKYEYTNVRIWTKTRGGLRLLYALTGESMISILHRLVLAEIVRVKSIEEERALEND